VLSPAWKWRYWTRLLSEARRTHFISKGVAGCEEPPTVWAKLVMGPLLGRGLPKPVLPIGTPPPKAQVPPLLARIAGAPVSISQI
jgi:hypothetical protein